MTDKEKVISFIENMRANAIEMAHNAGKAGCHIGGSFSSMEILGVLYSNVLHYDVNNPEWEERDRFIPSKTHCILSHFTALAEAGYVPKDQLMSFHEDGGLLAGHPWNLNIGLEFAGGSLGMGISVGVGKALYAKCKGLKYNTYVLVGDGEANEGSVWEAFMSAAQYKLDNLTVIVDYNNMQFDGPNDAIMALAPLADKMRAFGFETVEVDGHSVTELMGAFQTPHDGKPLAIVAHTIKAHGVPSLENKAESHHAALSEEDYLLLTKKD
jgi:transketolase